MCFGFEIWKNSYAVWKNPENDLSVAGGKYKYIQNDF